MSASKLETFVASLPSMKTSELLRLLFADPIDNRRSLYVLVATDAEGGIDQVNVKIATAMLALGTEIDRRIPPREEAR